MGEPIRRVRNKTGTVYEVRVDGVPYPDGRRKQVCRRYPSLKEAKLGLAAIRSEVAAGTFVGKNTVTLRRLFDTWLDGKRNIKPSTRQGYKDVTRRFLTEHGDLPVQKLSKSILDAYISNRLELGRSPTTVRAFLRAIRQPLDLAVRTRLITSNPADYVELPMLDLPKHSIWTPEQAHQFTVAALEDRLAPLWLLSMAGLRRGEVLGLAWSQIDLDKGTLVIAETNVLVDSKIVRSTPKTRRGYRTLPLWSQLSDSLTSYRRQQIRERMAWGGWPDTDLVGTEIDGSPIHPRTYSERFKRLSRKAKVPVIMLKNARHTSVTMMRAQGVPDAVVAAWHGHDESIMRAAYTVIGQDHLGQAASAIEGRF